MPPLNCSMRVFFVHIAFRDYVAFFCGFREFREITTHTANWVRKTRVHLHHLRPRWISLALSQAQAWCFVLKSQWWNRSSLYWVLLGTLRISFFRNHYNLLRDRDCITKYGSMYLVYRDGHMVPSIIDVWSESYNRRKMFKVVTSPVFF